MLTYPNREVKESFQEVLLDGLQEIDRSGRVLADELGEAIRQIEERGYAKRYEAKGYEVMKVGIVFDIDERRVKEIERVTSEYE